MEGTSSTPQGTQRRNQELTTMLHADTRPPPAPSLVAAHLLDFKVIKLLVIKDFLVGRAQHQHNIILQGVHGKAQLFYLRPVK
jgi:hypothetical protein